MKNKMLLSLLCVTVTICLLSGPAHSMFSSPIRLTVADGWVEERDNVTILHVSGSNYDMGYQHGFLLRDQVRQDIRAFNNYTGLSLDQLLEVWDIMKPYVPQDYLDELQGIADGANLTIEEVAAANIAIIVGGLHCFGIAAWGNATIDGRLYQTRSFDQPMDVQDPITMRYVHENGILVVRQPDNGYASIAPSIAGSMHGGGGFNDQGIAVGQHTSYSHDSSPEGMPAQFRVQQVLDHAATADEAVDFLTSSREMGWTFIVSDSKVPIGYAVETTANHSYAGTDDDPVEASWPFWVIDDVVRRSNIFIDPACAATQRDVYRPSGFVSFVKLVKRTDVSFAVWRSYKVVSEGIEDHYGFMDLNSSMSMMRACYSGKTDLLLRLIVTLAEGTSFNRAWNLWVACPQTGDLVVSFSTRSQIAFNCPVHFFNFFDLLNETPP